MAALGALMWGALVGMARPALMRSLMPSFLPCSGHAGLQRMSCPAPVQQQRAPGQLQQRLMLHSLQRVPGSRSCALLLLLRMPL